MATVTVRAGKAHFNLFDKTITYEVGGKFTKSEKTFLYHSLMLEKSRIQSAIEVFEVANEMMELTTINDVKWAIERERVDRLRNIYPKWNDIKLTELEKLLSSTDSELDKILSKENLDHIVNDYWCAQNALTEDIF